MMNILLLSVGTRNKIVQYFKQNFKDIGNVIAADCWDLAPALYEADKYYIVPRITEANYLDNILNICKKEKISGVLSLIDPELTLLSKNKNLFEGLGITVIGSEIKAVDLAFDKMKMYEFCSKNDIDTIKSYNSVEDFSASRKRGEIDFPVFVKPIFGSCSFNIQKVVDLETLLNLFLKFDNLMIQEFMLGQEIGCDVYIDCISNEVVDIFTKKKILMRAGETDKSMSFKDEQLFEFVTNFVKKAGFKWNIDIDIFERDGKYCVSEVNPRFGGGYPHAYECGCNFIQYIIKNLNGEANCKNIGNYDENIFMMKYLDLKIKK